MAPAKLDWGAIIRQKGGKKSEASGGLLGQACNRNTNKMNYGCFQKYFGRHMIMFATLNPITVLYSAITVIWQILEGLLHTL